MISQIPEQLQSFYDSSKKQPMSWSERKEIPKLLEILQQDSQSIAINIGKNHSNYSNTGHKSADMYNYFSEQ